MSVEYIRELNEAYNYFFFRYKAAPLLIVRATDIDFVHKKDDFEDLVTQILRTDRAPVEYYNPGAKG
jgi:deoxyadenosine/deoxycytidine kinase